jgi:hypothetical protein
MSFAELMREGAERGLVAHPQHGFTYRTAAIILVTDYKVNT